ncbi:Vacuolar-sorting protein SNF8 [Orchesella cincta]|uniref:Vacuolar-sorting protein SNF8 n=1 Tax=Orchesella cincta TaxID=48709 RepID=A0A1D2MH69_ORCCI|nr:Vacuolar-sorting protein SNF8 [Orchesella cincta]
MVYCVPEEMSSDGTKVIKFVAQSGKAFFVTADVAEGLGWEPLRAKTTIDNLIRDGIVWVDIGTMLKHICKMYWLPGLFLTTDAMPDM